MQKSLAARHDPDGERLTRFLALPDLSRAPESPIHELVERIKKIPRFASFDTIHVPEIVPADISFDLFNFPPDHPARMPSDTYFIDSKNILRTHTTVMWYYYLLHEEIKKKIAANASFGALSYGKVYRKDEIDRNHMNVFHQMDGLYLAPRSEKVITINDLQEALVEIAQSIFGVDIKYRFNKDAFPYTDPSLEMEVQKSEQLRRSPEAKSKSQPENSATLSSEASGWVEVLGGGVVQGGVLKKLGMDSDNYTGWAFGFGLERLAIISMELPDIRLLWSKDPRVRRQLHLGTKFVPVSKYPPIVRDISFVVDKDFVPNNYFDLIRDIGGDLVEEVHLLDKYENPEKFAPGKISYTYRMTYRSNDRTLTTEEIEPLQEKLYKETASQFHAEVR